MKKDKLLPIPPVYQYFIGFIFIGPQTVHDTVYLNHTHCRPRRAIFKITKFGNISRPTLGTPLRISNYSKLVQLWFSKLQIVCFFVQLKLSLALKL